MASSLAAGLKAAAGKISSIPTANPTQPSPNKLSDPPTAKRKRKRAMSGDTVMIGAHFSKDVRRTLLLVQAERINSGKGMQVLLGEAINDLCAKYGKPEPYTPPEDAL